MDQANELMAQMSKQVTSSASAFQDLQDAADAKVQQFNESLGRAEEAVRSVTDVIGGGALLGSGKAVLKTIKDARAAARQAASTASESAQSDLSSAATAATKQTPEELEAAQYAGQPEEASDAGGGYQSLGRLFGRGDPDPIEMQSVTKADIAPEDDVVENTLQTAPGDLPAFPDPPTGTLNPFSSAPQLNTPEDLPWGDVDGSIAQGTSIGGAPVSEQPLQQALQPPAQSTVDDIDPALRAAPDVDELTSGSQYTIDAASAARIPATTSENIAQAIRGSLAPQPGAQLPEAQAPNLPAYEVRTVPKRPKPAEPEPEPEPEPQAEPDVDQYGLPKAADTPAPEPDAPKPDADTPAPKPDAPEPDADTPAVTSEPETVVKSTAKVTGDAGEDAAALGGEEAAGGGYAALGAVGEALGDLALGPVGLLVGVGTILAGVFGHKKDEAIPRHDPNNTEVANLSTQFGV